MNVADTVEAMNRLEHASKAFPSGHAGRLIIRELIGRILDDASIETTPHHFQPAPLDSSVCALCLQGSNSHDVLAALEEMTSRKLRLVKLESVEELRERGAL
jgi:hypothetical protein